MYFKKNTYSLCVCFCMDVRACVDAKGEHRLLQSGSCECLGDA